MGHGNWLAGFTVALVAASAAAFDGAERRTLEFDDLDPLERLVIEPFTAHPKRTRRATADGVAYLADGAAVAVHVRRNASRNGRRVTLRINEVDPDGPRLRGRIRERTRETTDHNVRLKLRDATGNTRLRGEQLEETEHAPGSILSCFDGGVVLTTGFESDGFTDVGVAEDGRLRIAGTVPGENYFVPFTGMVPGTSPVTWRADADGISAPSELPAFGELVIHQAQAVRFTSATGPAVAALGVGGPDFVCVPEVSCVRTYPALWLGDTVAGSPLEALPAAVTQTLAFFALRGYWFNDEEFRVIDPTGAFEAWPTAETPVTFELPAGASGGGPSLAAHDGTRFGGTFRRDSSDFPAFWDADGTVHELRLPADSFALVDAISPDGRWLGGGIFPNTSEAGWSAVWDLDAPESDPIQLVSSGRSIDVHGLSDRIDAIGVGGLALGRSYDERVVWLPGWESARPFGEWLSEETGFEIDERGVSEHRITRFADGWAISWTAIELNSERAEVGRQSYVAFIPRD